MGRQPTEPGFYWALWTSAAEGTYEADQMKLPFSNWEVVEVWENFVGEACEADAAEKFAVHVCGVREAQWLENFDWGTSPTPLPYRGIPRVREVPHREPNQ